MKVGFSTKGKGKRRNEIEAHWNHRSYRMCATSDQWQNSGLACLYLPGTPRVLSIGLVSLNSLSSDRNEDLFAKSRRIMISS